MRMYERWLELDRAEKRSKNYRVTEDEDENAEIKGDCEREGCRSEVVAARALMCGHVFCLSCYMYFADEFSSGGLDEAYCPARDCPQMMNPADVCDIRKYVGEEIDPTFEWYSTDDDDDEEDSKWWQTDAPDPVGGRSSGLSSRRRRR